MGKILDWLVGKDLRKAESDNKLFQAFYSYLGNGQVSWYGYKDQDFINNGYLGNDIVFAAVRIYLNKVKVPRVTVNRVVEDNDLTKYKELRRKSGNDTCHIEAIRVRKKALDEIKDHELTKLLNNPNTYQTGRALRESFFGYLKTLGNAYLYGIGPGDDSRNFGKYTELHVLPGNALI